MASRREFLGKTAVVTAAVATAGTTVLPSSVPSLICANTETISLCGRWRFQVDPRNAGTREPWFAAEHSAADWRDIEVPHTWQDDPSLADYRGTTWYRREFDALSAWHQAAARVEFEAVFHTATVWVNGQLVGEHLRKGYTAFAFDITPVLRWGQANTIAVRVDSAFNEQMLPRGRSSDWANDGILFRPVQLLITPKTFIERVAVDAMPDLNSGESSAHRLCLLQEYEHQTVEGKGFVSSRGRPTSQHENRVT